MKARVDIPRVEIELSISFSSSRPTASITRHRVSRKKEKKTVSL